MVKSEELEATPHSSLLIPHLVTMSKSQTLIVLMFLLFTSCQKEEHATYLHIAHTRSYDGSKDRLMSEVEALDLKKYEVLMLGGDLVLESTGDRKTLNHLDEVFDLSKDHVLWTLGNHDYRNHPEWIPEVTKRPNAFSFYKNNISYLVFDSQEDHCNTTGAQKEMLDKVVKTLKSETTHLIILHHKLIWMMDKGKLQNEINEVSNGGAGDCFYCVPENDFYSKVFPKLIEVQKKGIQVICIAGDIGAKKDQFEHQTKEGIYFLASGLKDQAKSNKVLLFDHNLETGNLTWAFEELENLPTNKK